MDNLLVIKILIFIYIIISPFISHSWLSCVNATPIKVILLIIIVLLSFIDLQLAVLSMIAFFILLVNLNKQDLFKMNTDIKDIKDIIKDKDIKDIQNIQDIKDIKVIQNIQDIPIIQDNSIETMVNKKEQMIRGQSFPLPEIVEQFENKNQTIYNFPQPYCNTTEYEPNLISNGIYIYSIDNRTKPYEEYIRKLSPEKSLELIQSNTI